LWSLSVDNPEAATEEALLHRILLESVGNLPVPHTPPRSEAALPPMSGLEPPYRLIRNGLESGSVIPFLGAGASLGAAIGGGEGTEALPSGPELAEQLALDANFPAGEERTLASVAQYYEDVAAGRVALYEQLHTVFTKEYAPGRIHRYLAGIAGPLLIVSTNYDDLVERALREAGKPFDLVIHTTDPSLGERLLWWGHGADEPELVVANKLYIDLKQVTVVYKMHGAVDRIVAARDQYVITEDDYVDFLTRLIKQEAFPAILAEPFQKRHFLFLGYGLRDWNLRVILNRVDKDLRHGPEGSADPRSWAIDAFPSDLETRLWQGRGVEIYRLAIDAFLDALTAA
jgi:SIR2-like domain